MSSHLLIATRRRTALDGLGLEVAGIWASPGGIKVDRQQTSNPHVPAIGDCRVGPRFTHAAGYEGSLTEMAIGSGLPAPADDAALLAIIYTDPGLAQLGLTDPKARRRYKRVRVVREAFAGNDRSVADGTAAEFARVVLAGGASPV